jgi:O-antigen ligase
MYRRLLMFGLVLIPVVGVVWASLPEESRQYASSFDSGRYNIRARELNSEWALEQWKSSPWIGVGVGLRKEFDATNVILLTLAESGPLGVLAVLGVHFWVLWGMWRRRSGLKDLSAPWASSHALAGAVVLSKFVHGLVDHYWSRGAIMIAWASVGFALSASRISGARRRHAVLSPRLPLKKMVRAHKGKAAYA